MASGQFSANKSSCLRMEVTLVDFQGIPAESIVSIRAGNERRQATAKPNHPFKFPSAPKDSNPFRIDVYSPLGSRLVSLDTTQTRHMVDLGGMSMTLDIKSPDGNAQAQAQGTKIPVPAISGMKAKLGQASEFNTYLERHNMISFIQDLFMDLLHRRPDSPYDYLVEKLHGAGIQQSVMKEQEESDMRIHELLDIMQDDKAEIKKQFGRASLSPDLPSYLTEMFASEDFERLCNDRFSRLDVDDNAVLTAEELFPVIIEISQEQAHSVTFEHCVRFLKIFDEAKNGCLSQKEFFEFCKFVHLMHWLDDQLLVSPKNQDLAVIGSGAPLEEPTKGVTEVVTLQELDEDEIAINGMLDIMHRNVVDIKKVFGKLSSSPHLPDWLRETLTDDSFVLQCNGQFDDLDRDSNGTLSPDELFPLIIQLSSGNPLAVTNEHCERLTTIFDEDKNGVISRSEFVELTRFIFLIMWLENQDQGEGQEMAQTVRPPVTVEELLDMVATGVSSIKTHMGRITDSPDLPDWLHNLLVSEEFVLACQSQFDELDKDGNGSLSPDELTPVIVSIAEGQPITVLPEHCAYLTTIFDADNNGTISRGEFVELVRFIFVVQWLNDHHRLEAVLRLHDVLSMMEKDVMWVKSHMDEIMASPDVGPWIRELFMSEEFPLECKKFYDQLDADGNGVLSRGELVPVLVQLTGEHPITITEEHCQQLLEIFDEDNNGVISRDEFTNIAQFVFVMQWLEDQKIQALEEQEALEVEAEIDASAYRIAQIIKMFQNDKAELKKQFGDISKSPDLPEWFRNELSSSEFEQQCAEKFTALDIDQNGSLSLDELYPVIEEITDEHPIAITLVHCQQLMEVVDSNKNGTISKDEFKEFIQFVCLVKWLEGLAKEEAEAELAEAMDTFEAAAQELELEMAGAEAMAIDAILESWRGDRTAIKQQLGNIAKSADLPDWLRDVFKDPGFITECEAQFDALDANKNGTLSPDEVFPLVVDLVAGRPVAVDTLHCMKFIEIFDDDNSGGLDRAEFADFVQFVCLMKWLEAEDAARQQVEEDELRVHQLLDMLEVDAAAVKKNFNRASMCPDIPVWMREQFAQDEFTTACNEKYDALDQDGNGMLSPDELYPVILELSGGHPMSVTIDHCKRLIKMFDEEKKGVLSRTEFADFVKFIWLQLWAEQQRLQQMMELDSLEAEWRITNLLDMWHHNMIGLKGKWGTVCNSPDVPAWLKETLMDSSMTEMCEKQFDEYDVDRNGVLTANELLPVIVELCQEHPVDITQDHCQTLLEIFDEDKSGTIERGEFLEFVRFIVVVSWLQEQAGNIAPPQTPSMRSFCESDALDIEDRTDPLQSLGQAPPPPGLGNSPEKVFEGELKATQEALMATQNQLKAVQMQLQATTGQVAAALSGADMSSPTSRERMEWQKEKDKLLQELAAAKSLADMQKKGMAETVGKLMTEKMELESQLTMAQAGK